MLDLSTIFRPTNHIVVWESDLSNFVSKFYGRPWRMQQGEMLGQDTYRTVEVSDNGPDDPDHDTIEEWLALPYPCDTCADTVDKNHYHWFPPMHFEREHYVIVDKVLHDFYTKGMISAGEYQIQVWW